MGFFEFNGRSSRRVQRRNEMDVEKSFYLHYVAQIILFAILNTSFANKI